MYIHITDESVINSVNVNCFFPCDPSSGISMFDPFFGVDTQTGDINNCCSTTETSRGYGTDTTCTLCKFSCIIIQVAIYHKIIICISST